MMQTPKILVEVLFFSSFWVPPFGAFIKPSSNQLHIHGRAKWEAPPGCCFCLCDGQNSLWDVAAGVGVIPAPLFPSPSLHHPLQKVFPEFMAFSHPFPMLF